MVQVENTDQNVTLATPFSCCKVEGTFPNVEPVDEKCAVEPSAANNNKGTVNMIHPIAPYFCPPPNPPADLKYRITSCGHEPI